MIGVSCHICVTKIKIRRAREKKLVILCRKNIGSAKGMRLYLIAPKCKDENPNGNDPWRFSPKKVKASKLSMMIQSMITLMVIYIT